MLSSHLSKAPLDYLPPAASVSGFVVEVAVVLVESVLIDVV